MEKDIYITRSQIANVTVSLLTLAALVVVYLKSCKEYNVVNIDSPALVLAILSALPYAITFLFSFFINSDNHRKAFYACLGILFFMTGLEWTLPRTVQMQDFYSVIWFFQTVFVIPFLFYTIKSDKE